MSNYEDIDKLIPDDLLKDVTDFKSDKQEKKHSKLAKKSNFILTINPNFSYKQLDSVFKKKGLARRLILLNQELETGFKNGNFLKKKGLAKNWIAPPVISYDYKLEKGHRNGFIHTHSVLRLDGTAHVDVSKLRNHIKTSVNGFKRPIHLDVRWFQSSTENIMDAYINKSNEVSDQIHDNIDKQTIEKPIFTKPMINRVVLDEKKNL